MKITVTGKIIKITFYSCIIKIRPRPDCMMDSMILIQHPPPTFSELKKNHLKTI